MSTVFVDPMTGTLPISPINQVSPTGRNRILNSPRRVQSVFSPPQGFFTITQQSLDTSLHNSRINMPSQSQGQQPQTDSRLDSLKLCVPLAIVFLLFYWGFCNTLDNTISNIVTSPPSIRIKQIESCQGFLFGSELCKLICAIAILCQVLIVLKTMKDYYSSEQSTSPFDWIKLYRKVAIASLAGIFVTLALTEFIYMFGDCSSGEHIYNGTIFFCIVILVVLLLHTINQRRQQNQ